MAILIPSKNIYDKQNPKVRDNVIERIEVNAFQVLPNNEFDVNVFVKSYTQNEIGILGGWGTNIYGSNIGREYAGSVYSNGYGVVYLGVTPYYLPSGDQNKKITITIPKQSENSFIDKVNYGSTASGNNIGITVLYYKHNGTAKGTCIVSDEGATREFKITEQSFSSDSSDGKTSSFQVDLSHSYTWNSEYVNGQSYTTNIDITENFNENNLDNITSANIRQDEDNFYIDLKVFCGYERIALGGYTPPKAGGTPSSKVTVNLTGTVEIYEPIGLEITFKGNKIGIELTNKTEYINGETAKKVHSVDGNELMQTSNYYQSTDTNAIKRAFNDTFFNYNKGKETATILCDMNDYYEYNSTANNFKGKKVISIDNSTGKMSFKIYDQVIPMVYGADGKDHPMSLLKDGSAKVFQVLGTKIYYDGAVWQELSLQELTQKKNEIYPVYFYIDSQLYATINVESGKNILESDSLFPVEPTPKDYGYTNHEFDGWYTNKNGLGEKITTTTTVIAPITCYAYFFVVYTITFNPNGGVCDWDTATTDRYGTLGYYPEATREGYILNGWAKVDGTMVDYFTVYTENTTIYAQWIEDPNAIIPDAQEFLTTSTGGSIGYYDRIDPYASATAIYEIPRENTFYQGETGLTGIYYEALTVYFLADKTYGINGYPIESDAVYVIPKWATELNSHSFVFSFGGQFIIEFAGTKEQFDILNSNSPPDWVVSRFGDFSMRIKCTGGEEIEYSEEIQVTTASI